MEAWCCAEVFAAQRPDAVQGQIQVFCRRFQAGRNRGQVLRRVVHYDPLNGQIERWLETRDINGHQQPAGRRHLSDMSQSEGEKD